MLTYLRIRDLAVIDEVSLEPGSGLTVLTGETGAGKSIIFDGLALALGERASLDLIRDGADRAEVEAVFSVAQDSELSAAVREHDLGAGAGELVVRRVLTASGSRAYVNDRLVSLQQLKRIGDRLVDLHGQHEHQSLLSVGAHRDLLDRYGDHGGLRRRTEATFDSALELAEQRQALMIDERARAQRLDLLRFQVQEIEAAGLREGEDEGLERERRLLVHAEELAAAGAEAAALLYEDEDSAAARVHQAVRRLGRLIELDPAAPVQLDPLTEARLTMEETGRALQGYLDRIEADPRRLAEIEERLAVIDRLERKYGDSVVAVLEHARRAADELAALDRRDEELSELDDEVAAAVNAYTEAAGELGKARSRSAERLVAQVGNELAQLAMSEARFEVRVSARTEEAPHGLPPGAGRTGSDRVEFVLAANPGEKPGPLRKVASGGELSRLMLALKLSATEGDPIETLVFDEVDAGIGGGRVAERLAQRLAELGRSHQVLVVTHLPQIAAYADHHVGIRKTTRAGRVHVDADLLEEGEQIDELARMLGGLEITEATRRHAREMLAARR